MNFAYHRELNPATGEPWRTGDIMLLGLVSGGVQVFQSAESKTKGDAQKKTTLTHSTDNTGKHGKIISCQCNSHAIRGVDAETRLPRST